ncbi:MAG: hypothetical protein DRJ38_02865 [Thermoprotei archaeon]|nr:MAG: hypothetical protein DRJ38_02865 [Thermoprotei archaeon]
MKIKANPSILFLYGLTLTILAFTLRKLNPLAFSSLLNLSIGLVLGFRKYRFLIAAFLLSLVGVAVNALIFAGGEPVYHIGCLVIRSGAITGFIEVSLRLALMFSATLIFSSLTNPRDLLRSLESELGLPKQVSFTVSLSLRLLKIFETDIREIQAVRKSRGLRTTPITPSDWDSFLSPLLSLGLERGRWIGIATELRGFSLRKVKKTCLKLGFVDFLLLTLMLIQVLASLLF